MKNEVKMNYFNGTGVYQFHNGYGASVICIPGSYGFEQGLYELAVITFDKVGDLDWDLCYDTEITDDVLGYLTEEEVDKYLEQISKLKSPSVAA